VAASHGRAVIRAGLVAARIVARWCDGAGAPGRWTACVREVAGAATERGGECEGVEGLASGCRCSREQKDCCGCRWAVGHRGKTEPAGAAQARCGGERREDSARERWRRGMRWWQRACEAGSEERRAVRAGSRTGWLFAWQAPAPGWLVGESCVVVGRRQCGSRPWVLGLGGGSERSAGLWRCKSRRMGRAWGFCLTDVRGVGWVARARESGARAADRVSG